MSSAYLRKLMATTYSSSTFMNEKDFLRRKTKNFVVKDGLLFYSDKKKAADLQVLKAKACEFPLCLA